MPSASYSFLRGKNNYSPHLSLTVPDIIQECKTLIPGLFPFYAPSSETLLLPLEISQG